MQSNPDTKSNYHSTFRLVLLETVSKAHAFCLTDSLALINSISWSTLCQLLDNVLLDVRRSMWIMYDGAPVHSSHTPSECLPWMTEERQGPVSRTSRSPDLNDLEYFPWGYLKKYDVSSCGGYDRATAVACANWVNLGPQNSWHFSARPWIHSSSGQNLSGTTGPTFWASTATLTIVTSYH